MPLPRPRSSRLPLAARLSRRRVTYWLAVLALAVATAGVVRTVLDRAAVAEARFGDRVTAVVAREALGPGDPLEGAVERRRWPAALLPDDALTTVAPGSVAAAPIAAGEVVVRARVRAEGDATFLRRDQRALAVPVAVAGLPLRAGDRVDVLAVFDPASGGPPNDGPIASDATVVAVADEAVTVAVEAADAPSVAEALGTGTVVLALR